MAQRHCAPSYRLQRWNISFHNSSRVALLCKREHALNIGLKLRHTETHNMSFVRRHNLGNDIARSTTHQSGCCDETQHFLRHIHTCPRSIRKSAFTNAIFLSVKLQSHRAFMSGEPETIHAFVKTCFEVAPYRPNCMFFHLRNSLNKRSCR